MPSVEGMGRPRSFVEETVLDAAVEIFTAGGYEGTSIDDLITGLDLHRGSLYRAFGSKRGLFLAVLDRYVDTRLVTAVHAARASGNGGIAEAFTSGSDLDLLLVAAVERGPGDARVAALVQRALATLERALGGPEARVGPNPPSRALEVLAGRLFGRLHDHDPNTFVSASPKETEEA